MHGKVLTLVRPHGTRDMTKQSELDMAAAHIIKVRDRRIYEIHFLGGDEVVLAGDSACTGPTRTP